MSKIEDFDPTYIDTILDEASYIQDAVEQPRVPIELWGSPTQQFGILSVYFSDGKLFLDIEEVNDE